MGASGGSTQQTSRDLPGYAQGMASNALHGAWWNTVGNSDRYPFPDQQIAPLNPYQQQGLQMAADRAMAGSPVTRAMQGNLTDTLNGRYLDPSTNPMWQSAVSNITDAYKTGTAAQTDAAASRANAFDNSGYYQQVGQNQKALGQSLGDTWAGLYNQERGRQMQANLFAPQAAQADYQDAQALLGVGDTQRQYAQDLLNAQYQNQYNRADWPYQAYQRFGNLLNAYTGNGANGVTTSPNPYQPNKTAGALGSAMAGASIGSMAGPYGAAAGGIIGGLYGALA